MTPGEPFNPWKVFHGSFLPDWLFLRPELTLDVKVCYARLLRYAGRSGHCHPRKATLAKDLDVTERTVRNYLKTLEDHELIRIVPQSGRVNTYVFLWHPWAEGFLVKDPDPLSDGLLSPVQDGSGVNVVAPVQEVTPVQDLTPLPMHGVSSPPVHSSSSPPVQTRAPHEESHGKESQVEEIQSEAEAEGSTCDRVQGPAAQKTLSPPPPPGLPDHGPTSPNREAVVLALESRFGSIFAPSYPTRIADTIRRLCDAGHVVGQQDLEAVVDQVYGALWDDVWEKPPVQLVAEATVLGLHERCNPAGPDPLKVRDTRAEIARRRLVRVRDMDLREAVWQALRTAARGQDPTEPQVAATVTEVEALRGLWHDLEPQTLLRAGRLATEYRARRPSSVLARDFFLDILRGLVRPETASARVRNMLQAAHGRAEIGASDDDRGAAGGD